MTARRLALTTLVWLGATTGLLAPGVQVSSAAATHEFLSGVSAKLNETPLHQVKSMTVDSGELYVGEGSEASRIGRFDAASGAFLSQLPQLASPVYLHQGLVVGHSTGEALLYVAGDEETKGRVAVLNLAGSLQAVWSGKDAPIGGSTPSEGFGCFECRGPVGVAVDDSKSLSWAVGDVYVADPEHGTVDVFQPSPGGGEKYVAQLTGPEPGGPKPILFSAPIGVAVNQSNDEVYVADEVQKAVDIFKPAAIAGQYEFVGKLAGPRAGGAFERVTSVTVDGGNGDVYVAEMGSVGVDQFDAEGTYEGSLRGIPAGPFHAVGSVAVDPTDHYVYISNTFEDNENTSVVDVFGPDRVIPDVVSGEATDIKPSSATLNGTVNPDGEGEASCRFEWGTTKEFGQTAPCEPEKVAEGKVPVAVHAALTGLLPDTTYYYRLQATNKNGTDAGEPQQDREFTTSGPGLQRESVSGVAATSATLEATVNPHNAPTSYYFQYGKSVEYESEIPMAPGAPLGSAEGGVEVDRHVQQLATSTTYHYRVVAVSELEPGRFEAFFGSDRTFTTQAAGSAFALLDGRQWELVSPPNKHGGTIGPIEPLNVSQSSLSGSAITYVAGSPTENSAAGYDELSQIFSTRSSTGWISQDISQPHAAPTGPSLAGGGDYRFFSADLSLAIAEPIGQFTSLSPEVFPPDTEATPYLRHDSTCGSTPSTCYEPLLTGAPGYEDVPPGTKFSGHRAAAGAIIEVGFAGADPALGHVLLSSPIVLTPEPIISIGQESALYEWTAGQPGTKALQLVSVPPQSEGGKAATEGKLGYGNESARNAISTDGSRVVWSTAESLYLRDTAKGETIRLDLLQGGSGSGESTPHFQIANEADSFVFFTEPRRLTADSGVHEGNPDLYECEIVEVAGKLKCALSDLTPARGGEEADVKGGLLGASKDGSYVYFVASGVLSNAGNDQHEEATAGANNLYMLHHSDGVWEAPIFIGKLSSEDASDWNVDLSHQPTRVSPDGRYLAFMSNRSLTGYDNRDAISGSADEEVFLFDAQGKHLLCASCDPTGARPVGIEYGKYIPLSLAGGEKAWESNVWLAANIPGWTGFMGGRSRYQSRYLSDEGRLFFNSIDSLVPQDINGNEDVYEYEPAGIGSCSTSTSTFSSRSDGCVSLISSGTATGESAFVDASEGGGNVFFLTGEKLVSQDFDSAVDLYDARVCTEQSPCFASVVASPSCTTADACRAAPSPQPPIFGSPASSTFAGAGNVVPAGPRSAVKTKTLTKAQKLTRALAACHRKKTREKRVACERQARRHLGARRSPGKNATKGKR